MVPRKARDLDRDRGRRIPPALSAWSATRLAPAHPGIAPSIVRALCLATIVVLVTLGCRGDGGGPAGLNPDIAGDWSGSAYAYTVRFDATFTQEGQAVGGNGHFSSPIASGNFIVTGTLAGVEVNLILNSAELGATAFRGRFTAADRIEGTFDPGGSYETRLTLDRVKGAT